MTSPTEADMEDSLASANYLTNDEKSVVGKARQSENRYTHKQGQYLAFIYYYTKLNGRPPSEADMQRYFKTTPPAVHGMVIQLEKRGLIEKKPYEPRSIRLLLRREELPELE